MRRMHAYSGKTSRVSAEKLLDSIPVRNRAVTCREAEGYETVLAVPLKKRWYMKGFTGWLFPFGTHRRIGLDKLGAEVWENCDGMHTTEQIVEVFAGSHRLNFHEARLCVMQFLRELVRRGAVIIVGPAGERGNS